MQYQRDQLLNDLRNNVIEVTFNKISDNSTRVMRCTLMPQHLPESYTAEAEIEKEHHKKNPDVISAWDVQKGGWRSFRIDTVQYAQDIDGY